MQDLDKIQYLQARDKIVLEAAKIIRSKRRLNFTKEIFDSAIKDADGLIDKLLISWSQERNKILEKSQRKIEGV